MYNQSSVTIYIDPALALPDNDQWENRFEIHSETSDRVYIVAQNKKKRYWACSCPGWKAHRHCKHLQSIGVPSHERPYEPSIERR